MPDLTVAGAAARAAASAAAVCIYYVDIGGSEAPPYMYVHGKTHTAAAEAAAPAAAPPAALAAAPATDPWIYGSIFFIMKHIFYYEIKNTKWWEATTTRLKSTSLS